MTLLQHALALEGAAELFGQDPERLRWLMSRYFGEMGAIVERHGGAVGKFIGDAVMAVFGVPQVHDDDALRAVRAGLAIHVRTRRLGQSVGLSEPLEVRIGIEAHASHGHSGR